MKDSERLSEAEIALAQEVINSAAAGEYTLKKLFGSRWGKINDPTSCGTRFRLSVDGLALSGIEFVKKSTANHSIYRVG